MLIFCGRGPPCWDRVKLDLEEQSSQSIGGGVFVGKLGRLVVTVLPPAGSSVFMLSGRVGKCPWPAPLFPERCI